MLGVLCLKVGPDIFGLIEYELCQVMCPFFLHPLYNNNSMPQLILIIFVDGMIILQYANFGKMAVQYRPKLFAMPCYSSLFC